MIMKNNNKNIIGTEIIEIYHRTEIIESKNIIRSIYSY